MGRGKKFPCCILDFHKVPSLVQHIGISRYTTPIFILYIQNGNDIHREIYTRSSQTLQEVFQWVKFNTIGADPTDFNFNEGNTNQTNNFPTIPQLNAKNFEQLVMDPKKDVIILMADPHHQYYQKGLLNIEILYKLFEPFELGDKLAFYLYNPKTDPINGLQVAGIETGEPIFSVWPSGERKEGKSFVGYLPPEQYIEPILNLITFPLTQAQINDLFMRLHEFQQGKI